MLSEFLLQSLSLFRSSLSPNLSVMDLLLFGLKYDINTLFLFFYQMRFWYRPVLILDVTGIFLFSLQKSECGRWWTTTAPTRSESRARLCTNPMSWTSTTAPRLSSCAPSSAALSSANRKWYTAAGSPASSTQKVCSATTGQSGFSLGLVLVLVWV